jgi:hypothetical protein
VLRPHPRDVELDTLGHPWDERFHAGSRSKIKSGEWRRKKGVKKDDVVKHFAENGTISSSTDAVVPPTPPLAPPPPPTNGEVTWEAVVQAFAARSAKYTQEQIQAALRAAIIEPTSLHQSPAQYAAAIVALDAACPI